MNDARPPAPPLKDTGLRHHHAMLARLAAGPAPEAVILGDSLAAGWPGPDLDRATGVPTLNLGLPGDRVQTTRWRLAAMAAFAIRPRLAVAMVGTNSFAEGDDPDTVSTGLAALVAAMRAAWAPSVVVLATVPWRAPPPGRGEADRLALNDAIGALAGRDALRLLDCDAALSPDPAAGLEPDRLHLNASGYAALSTALAALLRDG
ncbi:SGNH/GDSL hydrolase family protein [Methylobacterium nonmethylotrophicum]|uniref:GDSL family lipase n=1 Tax=Methylobacterium nonmethylotrophicum TaxID=1141884 RepID=A0A4Z0NSY7_9HYPH|nr:GDSL-type esterase/lipase family protein [Methylobacterium nonmethylotrophicum]TGE00140.1 GDSL family lipase [Methylobacterium nonmethylotrophicum]